MLIHHIQILANLTVQSTHLSILGSKKLLLTQILLPNKHLLIQTTSRSHIRMTHLRLPLRPREPSRRSIHHRMALGNSSSPMSGIQGLQHSLVLVKVMLL